MTARTPAYLKGRFEQGDIPQGTDYEDLMDSYVNVATSAEQTIDSNLRTSKQFIADSVSANSINTSALSISVASAATFGANTANINTLSVTDASAAALRSASATLVTVTADNVYVSGKMILTSQDVSALATTQAGALLINAPTTFVIFANGNDQSVRLPTSERGRVQTIINAASTTIRIFPAVSGRFLVTAVNASINLPADRTALIIHKGDDRYGLMIGGF